ncbi:MAG: hypothetical protein KKD86_19065 [Bacteroidetes bacterium]|nr:hypothetical protein [Bacteroidota bacterium]
MKKSIVIICLTVLTAAIYPQGALPFLLNPQSPLSISAGNTGVAYLGADEFGFYSNPAKLGIQQYANSISFISIPKQKYYTWTVANFQNYGLKIGYDLSKSELKIPFTVGLAYLYHKFSYGIFTQTSAYGPEPIAKFESYDSFNSLSFGLGYEYLLNFHLGITVKRFVSQLGSPIFFGDGVKSEAEGFAYDFGLLVSAPISDLLMNNHKYYLDNVNFITPTANFSLGAVFSNYGDEIIYLDKAQADPISRVGRIGYSIDFGIKLNLKSIELNMINYSFSAETEDVLIKYDNFGKYNYQSFMSDLNFVNNFIELKSSDRIVLRKGYILNLFETVNISSGSYKGGGFLNMRNSDGFAVSSIGISKLLNHQIENETVQYILSHFALSYYFSRSNIRNGFESNYSGISLSFHGFNF